MPLLFTWIHSGPLFFQLHDSYAAIQQFAQTPWYDKKKTADMAFSGLFSGQRFWIGWAGPRLRPLCAARCGRCVAELRGAVPGAGGEHSPPGSLKLRAGVCVGASGEAPCGLRSAASRRAASRNEAWRRGEQSAHQRARSSGVGCGGYWSPLCGLRRGAGRRIAVSRSA